MNHTDFRGTNEIKLPCAFRAAGIAAGLKMNAVKDLALIVSDQPAAMASVFTTNQVTAAPVKLGRERAAGGAPARAVIVNSGNANAGTGAPGLADARRMAEVTAECLNLPHESVWVCSTGHIGARLPMDLVEPGIRAVAEQLSPEGGHHAAEAILTTDLRVKYWTVTLPVEGQTVTLSGIAKGAGMIEPNMATMLAFLLTDANIEPSALQRALTVAVNQSFNRITVDGDQSTNDTVLLLANGAAGPATPLDENHADWPSFVEALHEVCLQLARCIVEDGEGATKRITVRVEGAESDADADRAARAVANSFLVKTSWAGVHANWGRVMAALGYSQARLQEDAVDIWYDDHPAARGGVATDTAPEQLDAVIRKPEFTLRINLHLGEGCAIVYTCEITENYVQINVT